MKKSIQKIPLYGGLVAGCILLVVAANVVSFVSFYATLSLKSDKSCAQYYVGASKGTIWKYGEWHHYVDFYVDKSAPLDRWQITEAPLPSSLWGSSAATPLFKRVSYRWPSNWADPFPASNWKIYLLSS